MAKEKEAPRKLSRRDFVKGAAAVAGAGALAGCAPAATPAPAPTCAPAPECPPAAECAPCPTPWLPEKWDAEADVVVVGYGGAGGAAAITCHDAGAKVLILEKMPMGKEGGNTFASGGGLVSPLPENRDYFRQYLEGLDPYDQAPGDIHDVAADEICKNAEWIEQMGGEVDVTGEVTPPYTRPYYGRWQKGVCEWDLIPGGLESVRKIKAVGGIFELLSRNVEDRQIEVLYETPGKRLIQDGVTKEILGVVAESGGKEISIKANRGVILTCGSYEFNEDMHHNYSTGPCLYHGTPANTGDGILMAQAVGADLWHMNDGQMYGDLNAMVVPDYESPVEFTRASLGISVDKFGKRFMDETIGGCHGQANSVVKYFSKEYMTYPMVPLYSIFDEEVRESTKLFRDTMDWVVKREGFKPSEGSVDEIEKGWFLKADTIKELGEKILALPSNEGLMDPAVLEETVAKYNTYCQQGIDPDFGRRAEALVPKVKPPFYAAEVYPGSRNTQGGPRRDAEGRIVDTWGKAIPRLYSAGELGSIWVRYYQGSGNVAECLAFGRIAGRNAAAETPWA